MEIAGEYLKKGGKVYIEVACRRAPGRQADRPKKYMTEIVASDLILLGGRGEGGGVRLRWEFPRCVIILRPPTISDQRSSGARMPAGSGSQLQNEDIPF